MSTVSLHTRQRFTGVEPSGTIAYPPVLVSPLQDPHAHAMPETAVAAYSHMPRHPVIRSGYAHTDARQMGGDLPVYWA
ncbi:hypothetical protein GGE65_006777 [Skermanella aerolata]|uniref:hypothetical protein n=1 Tax=Skermanella aerolata TaxID=393310 RepID=UPI003D1A0260